MFELENEMKQKYKTISEIRFNQRKITKVIEFTTIDNKLLKYLLIHLVQATNQTQFIVAYRFNNQDRIK